MLEKQEKIIMNYILSLCSNESVALVAQTEFENELLQKETDKIKFDKEIIAQVLKSLQYDGYFDVINTDRHGENVYCITLLEKGKGYVREVETKKRQIYFSLKMKIALTIGGAVLAYILGLILKAIF